MAETVTYLVPNISSGGVKIDNLEVTTQTIQQTLNTQGPTNLGNEGTDVVDLVGILKKDNLTLIDSGRILDNLRLVNLAADPATGNVGRLYFNTVSQKLRLEKTAGWADAGVTAHSDLSNLSFALSGHTGFAATAHSHSHSADLTLLDFASSGHTGPLSTSQHGTLATGDLHTQYLKADGTRPLSAGWSIGAFQLISTHVSTVGGTESALAILSTSPTIGLQETDATSGNQVWDIIASNGQLLFRILGDTNLTPAAWLTVSRNGVTPTGVTIAGTTTGTFSGDGANITGINATNIATGTLANARFPTALLLDGSRTLAGNLLADANNTRNLGSAAVIFATVFAGNFTGSGTTTTIAADADIVLDPANGIVAPTVADTGTIDLGTSTRKFRDAQLTGTVTAGFFTGSGANLTALNASSISTGTLADARLSTSVVLIDGTRAMTGALRPTPTDTVSLGIAADRWESIYLSTGGVRIQRGGAFFHRIYTDGSSRLVLEPEGANDLLIRQNAADVVLVDSTRVLFSRNLQFAEAINVILGSTTGTKWGTATTQKQAWYNAVPVVQATGIVDADGTLADITTKFNSLLAKLETYGLLAVA